MGPSRDRIRFPQPSTVAGRSSRSTRRCSGVVVHRSISPRKGGRRKYYFKRRMGRSSHTACALNPSAHRIRFALQVGIAGLGPGEVGCLGGGNSVACRHAHQHGRRPVLLARRGSIASGGERPSGFMVDHFGSMAGIFLLMLAVYSMTGVGSFFWSSGVVLLLATGTLGARLLGGGRLS